MAAGRARSLIDPPNRRDLARGQTVRPIAGLALNPDGIKPAGARITDHPVLHPIKGVALGEDRSLDDLELGVGNEALRLGVG